MLFWRSELVPLAPARAACVNSVQWLVKKNGIFREINYKYHQAGDAVWTLIKNWRTDNKLRISSRIWDNDYKCILFNVFVKSCGYFPAFLAISCENSVMLL